MRQQQGKKKDATKLAAFKNFSFFAQRSSHSERGVSLNLTTKTHQGFRLIKNRGWSSGCVNIYQMTNTEDERDVGK